MKVRVVPASEITPKTLRAKDYLPDVKSAAWYWAAMMLEIQLTNWERSGEKSPENIQEAEHIRSVIIPSMKTKADIIRRNRKAP